MGFAPLRSGSGCPPPLGDRSSTIARDRPATAFHRDAEAGMAVTIGRLRPCPLFDFKFVALSHNTIRGAAGGSLLGSRDGGQQEGRAAIEPPPGPARD